MKKTKYLVAALLLMGATTTFTSCIDNDEPAGITELRGAKAELLKAKAAVELANVSFINAQTAYKMALVEQQNLINRNKELDNQLKELDLQMKNEQALAAIEKIRAELAVNKLIWEESLLKQKVALEQAKKDYEDAMKALELSKEFLSDEELKVLNSVQNSYDKAFAELYGGSYKSGEDTVTIPEDESAKGKLEKELGEYEDEVTNVDNYISEEELEAAIAQATADRDNVSAELELKKEALKVLVASDEYNAWKDLQKVYNQKKDSLEIVKGDKLNQIEKIISENVSAITAVKAAEQAVKNVEKAAVADQKAQIALNAGSKYLSTITLPAGLNYITYDAASGVFTADLTAKVLAMKIDEAKTSAPSPDTERAYSHLLDDNVKFDDAQGYKAFNEEIAKAVKAVKDAKNEITDNEIANDAANVAGKLKAMEDAKKVADKNLAEWQTAVNNYVANPDGAYEVDEYSKDKDKADSYIANITAVDDPTSENLYAAFMEIYNKWKGYGFTSTQDISTLAKFLAEKTAGGIDLPAFAEVMFSNIDEVKKASNIVFGVETIDGNLVLVKPADKDITGGTYKLYLDAKKAYEDIVKDVEVLKAFDKAIEEIADLSTTLAEAQTAYMEKNKTVIDGFNNAKQTLISDIYTPVTKVNLKQTTDALTIVEDVLEYGIETEEGGPIHNLDKLVEDLKDEIGVIKIDADGNIEVDPTTGLTKELIDANDALLRAEKMLELFKQGNLDEQYMIGWAQAKLDIAKANYEAAVEKFNYWNKKLKEITEKLYSSVGE